MQRDPMQRRKRWRVRIAAVLACGAFGAARILAAQASVGHSVEERDESEAEAVVSAVGFSVEIRGSSLEAEAGDGTVACYVFDAPIVGVSANPTRPVVAVVTRPSPYREDDAKSYFLFPRERTYFRYRGASADAVLFNFEHPSLCPRAPDELISCSLDEDFEFFDDGEAIEGTEYYAHVRGNYLHAPIRHFLDSQIWSPDGSLTVLLPNGRGPADVVKTDDLERYLTGKAPPLRRFALVQPEDVHGGLLFKGWEGDSLVSLSISTVGESWQIRADARTGRTVDRRCVEGECLRVSEGRVEMLWVQTSVAGEGAIVPDADSEQEVQFVASGTRLFAACARDHFGAGMTGELRVSWMWLQGARFPRVEASGEARSSKAMKKEVIELPGYVELDGTAVPPAKSVRDVYEESPLPEPFVRCVSTAAEGMPAPERVRSHGEIDVVYRIGP